MQIPVLLEPVAGNGFRARMGEPLNLVVEGPTPDDALARLRTLVQSRLTAGMRLVPFDVPDGDNPWVTMAGIFKDDPLMDEWKQAMEEYRRQVDEDPDTP